MRVLSLSAENFRNLQNDTISFSDKMNVVFGDNAQGKTNLIEAIWLFSGAKSFRGSRDSEMIRFDADFAALKLTFCDKRRSQTAELRFGRQDKKKVLLNKVPLETRSKLNGAFYSVVFSPSHLSIISEGPRNRRRFLDDAISQINPQYAGFLRQYEKVLLQRNALLKDLFRFTQLRETVEMWDSQLARLGSILTLYRSDYIKKLNQAAAKIYQGLSGEKECFSVEYCSSVFENTPSVTVYDDKTISIYYDCLCRHLETDMKLGQTSVGIHRDDLEVLVNGKSAKIYGSQGQKRSSALALKLAEAELLQRITREAPVILLDDVMSELDIHRQEFILNHVESSQVFITCCDISNTLRLRDGKIYHVEDGRITVSLP